MSYKLNPQFKGSYQKPSEAKQQDLALRFEVCGCLRGRQKRPPSSGTFPVNQARGPNFATVVQLYH